MTPIKLYTWGTPNGQKASIMLEEVALPYVVQAVDISKGGTQAPDYLAMNPNGKIPLIEDPDNGRIVAESGAILLYLAELSGRLRPLPGSEELTWMLFQAAHVGPMLGQLGFFKLAATEKSALAIGRFEKEVDRILGVLDTRLGRAEYLGSGEFGLADIMTWPWISSAMRRLGVSLEGRPNLARWVALVGERPAVRAGMKVPELPPA